MKVGRLVSIPNRDFDVLQVAELGYVGSWQKLVSIPNRDFDVLQEIRSTSTTLHDWFQSLIGILMFCKPFQSRIDRQSPSFNP